MKKIETKERMKSGQDTLNINGLLDSVFNQKKIGNKHPVLYYLNDKNRKKFLFHHLQIINHNCNKFKRIIRKILDDNDFYNFHSLLTEIEIMSYYYQKLGNQAVEYEPLGKKGPDIKLKIKHNDYYLEILTLFDDEEDAKRKEINHKITEAIRKIKQPYVINFSTNIDFKKEDIDNFVSFIQKTVSENHQLNSNKKFNFFSTNKKLAEVTLINTSRKRGYLGYIINPFRQYFTSSRIKSKILTKLQGHQLPNNKKNIIVISPSFIHCDRIDIEDALLGQYCIVVDRRSGKNWISRKNNGVFHHKEGNNLSGVIFFEKQDYDKRIKYINTEAKNPLDEKDIELI